MDRLERIYVLHKILRTRRTPISLGALQERLGDCARATVFRLIGEMRDYLGAPIVTVRGQGYRYDPAADAYELPGLWFNASEIHALLAFRALLHNIQPGLLDAEIEPLRERIEHLLADRATGAGELERRVRILAMAARQPGPHFQTCANALVERKRLAIDYHGRVRNEITHRKISPQRLVHYRDNWYLDAWCHTTRNHRIFAVGSIRHGQTLKKAVASS